MKHLGTHHSPAGSFMDRLVVGVKTIPIKNVCFSVAGYHISNYSLVQRKVRFIQSYSITFDHIRPYSTIFEDRQPNHVITPFTPSPIILYSEDIHFTDNLWSSFPSYTAQSVYIGLTSVSYTHLTLPTILLV